MEASSVPVQRISWGEFGYIQSLVIDAVRSHHSKRVYARAVAEFISWWLQNGGGVISKAAVQRYRAELERRGLAPASINVQLSAIRKLVVEAADNGLLDRELAVGICHVKSARMAGVRTGQWLTRSQAEQLLRLPNANTVKGKRDRVILGLLVGCGLRRNELAGLTFERIQQRESRWVIVDLLGKGGRVRTVPMPGWAKSLVDEWAATLDTPAGPILRPINKRGVIRNTGMQPESLFRIVKEYSIDLAVPIAPHDLRRTFAKLAHRGRAPLEQIQISLGHSSVLTTERYLGIRQDLADAPCDHLGLNPFRD
jgi:integrase